MFLVFRSSPARETTGRAGADALRRGERHAARAIASHKTTLRRLHEVGVRSAGADQYRSSARGEVQHVLEHDSFDDETLLTLWAETTPQVVFPDRKIGRLDPGYEASFLVLGTDPTADLWAAANDIRRGVKESRQGIGEDE